MAQVKFSGGAALAKALDKIAAAASTAASVSIGFQNGAQEEDGTPVALAAAFNEYGVPSHDQPPRPFFRIAIEKNKSKWPINLATALKNNQFNAARALGLLGAEIKGEIEDSIVELIAPPLAASTIARKAGKTAKKAGKNARGKAVYGPAKPLIDTSIMLRNVTSVVE